MRLTVGILIISLSVALAYLTYQKHLNRFKKSVFLLNLSKQVISNTVHAMLPFHEIFCDAYNAEFKTGTEFESNGEVFDFMAENEVKDGVIKAIKAYLSAAPSELSERGQALLKLTEDEKSASESKLKEYGYTAFILYPSFAIMALILML